MLRTHPGRGRWLAQFVPVRPIAGRLLPLWLALAGPACGAHIHRPHDADASGQAESELRGARLTDGFAPELTQAGEMLKQELEVARAWAQQGRDRDLLDILSATAVDENDPDTEILMHPRCRGRYKADGWTTLCSKLTRRIAELGGLTLPIAPTVAAPEPVKPGTRARKDLQPRPPAGADPVVALVVDLRKHMRVWHGPQSDAARLAKASTDFVVTARAAGLSPSVAPPPRCPAAIPPPTVHVPEVVAAEAQRVQDLCSDRRRFLAALQTASCGGAAGCDGGRLGASAAAAVAVHDALLAYDAELSRRLDAYLAARRPCDAAGTQVIGAAGQLGVTGTSGQVGPSGPGVCDPAQVRRSFAALAEIGVSPRLEAQAYGALARQGRVIQLAEQLAALDGLIEAREDRPDPKRAKTQTQAKPPSLSPALAEALHGTITGIDRVAAVVDAFELAVLSLIRETLRIEHNTLTAAIGHAERRRRIELSRLGAQLEEYSLLVGAYADLQKLERAGCVQRPLLEAQHQDGCRDETTRLLLAYSNAWTLGRAGQQQADVLDLGVRHEASIDRSRAAMAVREVYLAAGIAELAKFNRGGIRPEALAQIIVSAVGFGVVAGGVY